MVKVRNSKLGRCEAEEVWVLEAEDEWTMKASGWGASDYQERGISVL